MYERKIMVVLSCNGEYMDEQKVEFVDVYADAEGRDKMVFICPICGEKHTSLRVG